MPLKKLSNAIKKTYVLRKLSIWTTSLVTLRILLLRWLWKLYNDQDSIWTVTIKQLKSTQAQTEGPLVLNASGSFFWKRLSKYKRIFNWCTVWAIGTGTRISFWHDDWRGLVLYDRSRGDTRPQMFAISLRDARDIRHVLTPTFLEPVVFSDRADSLIWRWEDSGSYSSKSAYEALVRGDRIQTQFLTVWKYSVKRQRDREV